MLIIEQMIYQLKRELPKMIKINIILTETKPFSLCGTYIFWKGTIGRGGQLNCLSMIMATFVILLKYVLLARALAASHDLPTERWQ